MDDHIGRMLSRRAFLGNASLGLGAAWLGPLGPLGPVWGSTPMDSAAPTYRGVIDPRHIVPRAKRVIHLCMAGGPSQFETFDYKPELVRLDGKPMPASYTKGQPIAQLQGKQLRVLMQESGREVNRQHLADMTTFKTYVFPPLMMAVGATIATFVVGGGVLVGSVPIWVHSSFGFLSLAMNGVAGYREFRCIRRNARLIGQIEAEYID